MQDMINEGREDNTKKRPVKFDLYASI